MPRYTNTLVSQLHFVNTVGNTKNFKTISDEKALDPRTTTIFKGLRGEVGISDLCWNSKFLEMGKKQLSRDTTRKSAISKVVDIKNGRKNILWQEGH